MLETFLMQVLIHFCPGIVLSIWEALLPRRQIKYLAELRESIKLAGITFAFGLFLTLAFTYFGQLSILKVFKTTIETSVIESMPLWLKLAAAYFLMDFSFYFLHFYMHNNLPLWKTHKLHHSTEKMWWLAGIRGSFIHVLLNKFPYLWFAVFGLPSEIIFIVAVHLSFHNCWQHLNVKGQTWMKFIEFIYVTPRYHSVHHSSERQLQCQNLGAYFTYLDRIFGTYVDPDNLNHSELLHGLGEDNSITTRMIVGL